MRWIFVFKDKLVCTLLADDLKELEDTQELDDSSRLAQASSLIDKMKKTIAQMKKYIGEEVNKLK